MLYWINAHVNKLIIFYIEIPKDDKLILRQEAA
jgi:hypothetical protein